MAEVTMLQIAQREAESHRKRAALHHGARYAAFYLFVICLAAIYIFPFYWMVSTSVKFNDDVFTSPTVWFPTRLRFENYVDAWNFFRYGFGHYLRNTSVLTVLAIQGEIVSCSLVAYGFARLRARASNVLFLMVLATMMVPSQVTLIPLYIGFARVKLIDSYIPLLLGHYLGGSPFHIFLLRQFLRTLPAELDDAAKIDGAGYLRTYWQIHMPLIKPALVTVAIFTFTGVWNDFFGPLIYLNNQKLYTLALALQSLQLEGGFVPIQARTAAAIMAALPPLLVFFFGQKRLVHGIQLTGIKG
jgi:multiple sugar transport system permease protein